MVMSQIWIGAETELLLQWLDTQRFHAIEILDGLTDEDLRRPIVAIGLELSGDDRSPGRHGAILVPKNRHGRG